MEEEKINKLENNGHEIDDVATFLGLTSKEVERIEGMILKARLECILDSE